MKMKLMFIAIASIAFAFGSCKTKDGASNTLAGLTKKEAKAIENERIAHENDTNLTFYTWNEGYLKAKRLNKILLVDIYTEWCGWCKVMDKKTYTDRGIITQLNKDFVCVKFNPEIAKTDFIFDTTTIDNKTLQAFLFDRRSGGYPTTTFWINPDKKERLEVVAGYKDKNSFGTILSGLSTKKNSSAE